MEEDERRSWQSGTVERSIAYHSRVVRHLRGTLNDGVPPVETELFQIPTAVLDHLATRDADGDSSTFESSSVSVYRRHDREADLEFYVDTGIACAILCGFAVWFAWSFWCNSKSRRSTRGGRRHRQERPHSLGSFSSSGLSTVGSINSSGIFQRDGRSTLVRCNEGAQVYNPMWTEQFQEWCNQKSTPGRPVQEIAESNSATSRSFCYLNACENVEEGWPRTTPDNSQATERSRRHHCAEPTVHGREPGQHSRAPPWDMVAWDPDGRRDKPDMMDETEHEHPTRSLERGVGLRRPHGDKHQVVRFATSDGETIAGFKEDV